MSERSKTSERSRSRSPLLPDAVTPRPAVAFPPPRGAHPAPDDERRARNGLRPRHAEQLRRQIKLWLYDEQAGLDAALDKLAHDLGVELADSHADDPGADDTGDTPPSGRTDDGL